MSRKDKATLAERVARAAKASLAAQGYASPVDVFLGIGWLNPTTFKDWQQGRVDCLDDVLHIKPSRQSKAA